jgi:hypothetical protein
MQEALHDTSNCGIGAQHGDCRMGCQLCREDWAVDGIALAHGGALARDNRGYDILDSFFWFPFIIVLWELFHNETDHMVSALTDIGKCACVISGFRVRSHVRGESQANLGVDSFEHQYND